MSRAYDDGVYDGWMDKEPHYNASASDDDDWARDYRRGWAFARRGEALPDGWPPTPGLRSSGEATS